MGEEKDTQGKKRAGEEETQVMGLLNHNQLNSFEGRVYKSFPETTSKQFTVFRKNSNSTPAKTTWRTKKSRKNVIS